MTSGGSQGAGYMAGARRKLVLLRHAKSDRPAELADHERPLAARGRREAPLAGRWLYEHVPAIDLLVCSTAARARQTRQLAEAELHTAPEVRTDGRLYAASAEQLLSVVRELPERDRTVVFVAHNPGLENLLNLLTGSAAELRTSAMAVLDASGGWIDSGPGWASLEQLHTPRSG